MKRKYFFIAPAVLAFGAVSSSVCAEPISSFDQAITQAVLTSPRVNADWYNFEATREAQSVARGGYYPSVDVNAEIGREERDTPLIDTGRYTRDAARLSITQMLFDGFQTRDEVARLGYAKLSRYYDLQRSSQEVALEAAQAYLDVVRYQKLVTFAEQNYVVHRQIYDKIAERTRGGVSQGVDLEQAESRIALAESNLLTEATNLHDVHVRFQRIVGDIPAEDLAMPSVPTSMIPELRSSALNLAYEQSPEINAAIENLRSTQSALNATNAPMMPRIDLRYRNEIEHDTDGFDGRFDEEAIELVLSYNLFRGGSDSARKREFYNRYNAAIEERKQACLNVRQNVMIAFNDARVLQDQIVFLDRSQLAQDKTRKAYNDQFDLGQRTLLDLLDSQNEYFDTQRAYISARADLMISQASTLSNMGLLLAAMDVDGLNTQKIKELNLNLDRGDDKNGEPLCPPEAPVAIEIDGDAIFAELTGSSDRYRSVGKSKVALELDVKFELNSSVISSSFDSEIANAAVLLKENPGVTAVVEGHTDSSGTPEYNQWLSDRRAANVRNMLLEEHGISADQVTAVGYGQDRPVGDNATKAGRMSNRRVDLVLSAPGAASE
ncbi:MAG: TolC family outer membrane protein [Proteobacteria bacterium]|nr:TolC family outer membrane protein [Pseudomonadota bacterium]